MSLKYEPASEPLHISAKKLFLIENCTEGYNSHGRILLCNTEKFVI